MGKRIEIGDAVPDFSLPTDTGETLTRADLLGGGPVVLYFYPKDDTPGCTVQACTFRDAFEDFVDVGATVIGVSSDGVGSHGAFRDKHRLPFTLLSDRKGTLRDAFGVPKTLGLMPGRVTYVIDAAGVVRHIYNSQLSAKTHVKEALEHVRRLAAGTE